MTGAERKPSGAAGGGATSSEAGGPVDGLSVLFESPALIAVDKPAGIIVHGDGTGTTTLTDMVRELLRGRGDARSLQAAEELQTLQRLDRETSGIVLFSCSKLTQARYDRMIAEHAMEKRYRAIVAGTPPWRSKTFSGPIGRDRHDARRMRVSRTGKAALTRVHVLRSARVRGWELSLLDVEIETGRKHQIRVHLSHAGFPIMGDALYGRPDRAGLMLHAARLSFCDPIDGRDVRITAPLPARMARLFPEG